MTDASKPIHTDKPASNYPHLRQMQRFVWNKHCKLSTDARHVAVYLLNYMSDAYEGAFPSVARMIVELGMGRDSIIKYTREVIDSGFLDRKPGRRGMYTYRVRDIDQVVAALDAKLAELQKSYWEHRSTPPTGRPERPVDATDRSTPPTSTGRSCRPVPVDPADTYRLNDRPIDRPRGNDDVPQTSPPTQVHLADTPLKKPGNALGAELHKQLNGGGQTTPQADNHPIPWVRREDLPGALSHTFRQAVYYHPDRAQLMLVEDERGRELYRVLRNDYPIEVIARALVVASGKAAAAAGRKGALGGLVRQYCQYTLEEQQRRQAPRQAHQEPSPWRSGTFQP